MNDFRADNAWQRRLRDEVLVPQFYGQIQGRYQLLDTHEPLTVWAQKRAGIDTVVITPDGRIIGVEEKIVRYPSWKGRPHDRFFLETWSCTNFGYLARGWMYYGLADRLLYCFETASGGLDCYYIDFRELKSWFWRLGEDFFPVFTLPDQNRTEGHLVPVQEVSEAVATERYQLQGQPQCAVSPSLR